MSQTRARPSRLALASIVGVLSQIISLGLALWVTPQLVHGLGDAAYSLLGIIGSFTSYFAYLELGIGAAYIRLLSMSLTLGQTERAQRLVATAHSIYTRIALIGFGGMLGLGIPYLV